MRNGLPLFIVAGMMLSGCSAVTLKPGDFSWPVESVLKVDAKGTVEDARYSLSVNVKELLFAETGDSVNVKGVTLRMIRDPRGYFYVTAPKFRNVYLFSQADGALTLSRKVAVSEKGLVEPAFNLRSPNVQLVREKEPTVLINPDGIVEGGKK
jgi:hypothetical protein